MTLTEVLIKFPQKSRNFKGIRFNSVGDDFQKTVIVSQAKDDLYKDCVREGRCSIEIRINGRNYCNNRRACGAKYQD